MPLSFNPSKPIPFYELDPEPFQELCRDLLEREEGISTCEIFGINGQSQRGIDLKAQRKEGYAFEVGQCKCYSEFQPHQIRAASDAFLEHIDYWKERNVRRFILFVACPMDTVQRQEEIDRQIQAFHQLGLAYEVWSARTLRTKLKDHPDIIWQYTRSQEWVETICGVTTRRMELGVAGVEKTASLIESVVTAQLPVYAGELSREVSRHLDFIRDLYRKGKKKDALGQLEEIQNGKSWEIIDLALKGRLLRQQAAYVLDFYNDFVTAQRLTEEAKKVDPEGDETAIRSILVYHREGAAAALQYLPEATSITVYNLRIAFLLELEKVSQAIAALQTTPAQFQPDGETMRVKALAFLMNKDVVRAYTEIQQALALQPDGENLRFVSALIKYYFCFSAAALPGRIVPWPEPPNWFALKRDEESLRLLKEAEAEFAMLAQQEEKAERKLILETWQLACLANDPYRQVEAQALCTRLLHEKPQHYRVLVWVLERGYDTDYVSCYQALQSLIAGDASGQPVFRIEALAVLLGLCLQENQVGQAREFLTQYEDQFLAIGAMRTWRFWRNQVFLTEGNWKEAELAARKERDPEFRRQLLLPSLRAKAAHTGKGREFLAYLDKSYQRTGRVEFLFEWCSIQAGQEKWELVAERAETLIEKSPTAAALRMAALALWHTQKVNKCLRLLISGSRFFRDNVLPADLERLKVQCQIAKGELPQSVIAAKELFRREQTTENILTLMQAHLRQADIKEFAVTARSLLHAVTDKETKPNQIHPQSLIRAASWVHLEDQQLAQDLWRQAAQLVIDQPDLLVQLVNTGHALGLDREVQPYLSRMKAQAKKGGKVIKRLSLKKLMAYRRKQAERLHSLQAGYNSGLFPLHLLTVQFNQTMASILHGMPERNRKEFSPLRQPRIYIRHGGRPLEDAVVKTSAQWRLHLDVSALLLAEDLGILAEVEKTFNPLFISPDLPTALMLQRHNLKHHQPSQINEAEMLLRLLQENKIQRLQTKSIQAFSLSNDLANLAKQKNADWISVLLQAQSERAYLVDYFPLKRDDLSAQRIHLPSAYVSVVINCRAVLDNLQSHGWIEAADYRQALDVLKGEKQDSSLQPDLPKGSQLYLMGNIASLLSKAGVLEILCQHFKVFVDESWIKEAEDQVTLKVYAEQLDSWLERLARRVREGLASGTYVCVTIPEDHPVARNKNEDRADEASLLDLMFCPHQSGDVLWLDDRWSNSYGHSDSAPIIGINEVLAALRQRQVISESDYFHYLHKLRTGNFRYIPISAEEVLYHLKQAPVTHNGLVETPGLRTLRKYVAACLLDEDAFQIPPLQREAPNPWGEMAFMFNFKDEVVAAIAGTWKEGDENAEATEARADWLLDNFYTGIFGLRHLLPNAESRGDATELAGLDLAGMYATGFLANFDLFAANNQPLRLKNFVKWFEERLLIPRLKANPEVLPVTASAISTFFTDAARQSYQTRDEENLFRLSKSLFYDNLPEDLKAAVELEPEVLQWLGIKIVDVVSFGAFNFAHDVFAQALETVLDGAGEARINDLDANTEYGLKLLPDQPPDVPVIALIKGRRKAKCVWRIRDEFLQMASPERAKREATMRKNAYWFDCDHATLEQVIQEINGIQSATERMDKLQEWRRQSAAVYYRNLAGKLEQEGAFRWKDLIPPSAEGLLRHYRLQDTFEGDQPFTALWQQAAQTLLIEEGVETTLDRMARLPIAIPAMVVEKFTALPQKEKDRILTERATRWRSPVSRLNLIAFILRTTESEQALPPQAQTAVHALFDHDAGKTDFDLFEALLDFSFDQFALWPETASWSPATRLAMVWAHTTKLVEIFHLTKGAPSELAKIFTAYNRQYGSAGLLCRQEKLWNDVLLPRRFNRTLFLTHGVAAAVEEQSPSVYEALDLRNQILAVSFIGADPAHYLPLLCDFTQAYNHLVSYLGGDHAVALSPIIGTEEANNFSSASLKRRVVDAVQALHKDMDGADWNILEIVLGELPIYGDVAVQLYQLLRKTNFPHLFEKNPAVAASALRVAINYAHYAQDDDLCRRLEEDLLRCLHISSDRSEQTEGTALSLSGEQIERLIDLAFRLSLKENDPRSTSADFSHRMRLFINHQPKVIDSFEKRSSQFLRQLPTSSLHGMWPFWLTIKAGK